MACNFGILELAIECFLGSVARIDFSGGPQEGAQYLLVSAGIIGTFSRLRRGICPLTARSRDPKFRSARQIVTITITVP